MSDENGSLLDSMESTMRDTLATMDNAEATAQTVVEPETTETATETAEEKAERLRDERGRFAKGETTAETAETPETTEQVEQPDLSKAPGSWPNEMKAKFGTLPPEVQDYITRREADVSRSINAFSQKAKAYDSISQVLQPYEGLIRADGLEPTGVINGLMSTYYALRNGAPQQKAAAVAQLINQFGVNLELLGEDGTAGNSAAADPQLYAKVSQLEQMLMTRQQADEQAQQAQVEATIEQFKATAPHFETVKVQMGALLEKGLAKDLQDAYDQACWASPEVRATLLQQQEAKRREEALRIAEGAKKAAAVNVTRRGIQPPAKPQGSMEDTMRETFRRLQNS